VRKTLPGEWMAWWARASWEGVREVGLISGAAAAAPVEAATAPPPIAVEAEAVGEVVELLLADATTVLL
jgi:hypothetical protein